MEGDDRAAAVKALRRGLDLGMTHVDTAEMYGNGRVEEIVADAIAGRRDEVFLATKVLPSNASYTGTKRACERSLARLKTDRIDLYMIHWPGSHPLEDTVRAFEELVREGKIRFFGVSNFDERELDDVVKIAGPDRVACNQVLYHLGERAIEHRILPACVRHRVPLVGYSPFGSGNFPSPTSARGKKLGELAAELGATPTQVCLAFLIREPLLFTIPKASNERHVEDNANAAGITLDAKAIARMEEIFPRGRDSGRLPTL